MTLKDLKKMIAEEYTAYKKSRLKEQPTGPTVAVSDDDVDAEGGNAEATLKDIYDMLKDFFEGGEEEAPEEAPEDVEGGEDETADLEEKSSTGPNVGFKNIQESRIKSARRKKAANAIRAKRDQKVLSERFQKLANIIK